MENMTESGRGGGFRKGEGRRAAAGKGLEMRGRDWGEGEEGGKGSGRAKQMSFKKQRRR
jgi:hypothetical protein